MFQRSQVGGRKRRRKRGYSTVLSSPTDRGNTRQNIESKPKGRPLVLAIVSGDCSKCKCQLVMERSSIVRHVEAPFLLNEKGSIAVRHGQELSYLK